MSLQRTRPIDTLQRIMSSFKHFEKKLDKLQDDVNFHGHTLTELRVMVANLSGGMLNSDLKPQDNMKRISAKQTMGIQPEDHLNPDMPLKTKRKSIIQPLTSPKIQAKSYSAPKYGGKPSKDLHPYIVNKLPSTPKTGGGGLGGKRSVRHRKGEAPRKATTLRSQKEIVKKRSKVPKHTFS